MLNINMKLLVEFWTFLIVIQGSRSLRNVKLVAPEAVQRGSSFVMKCEYELEDNPLYSVKWYRGDREFARYTPRDVPPMKIFRITGIDVVLTESDSSRLTVARATATSHGRYTCEVSVDAPSFLTARVYALVHVVDLPKSGPEVNGMKLHYRAGSRLRAECVSRHSLPPANLSFYINNEPASSKHIFHRVEMDPDSKLLTAYATVQFVVQRHDFVRHKIKIRCTARIFSTYHQSSEKCALEEREELRTTTSAPNAIEQISEPRHRLFDEESHQLFWEERTFSSRGTASIPSESPVMLSLGILNILYCYSKR